MNKWQNLTYSKRGFVIPMVIVVLFLAAVFGAIYNQSIRAQRKLDLMFEHDLRSFYIAQAGFQTFSSRLQSLDNYESRWYTTESFTQKVDYAYTEEGGKGYYSVFASEVKVNQKFQHVFLLVKGVYEDNTGNKNITIVKANLSYDPPPPSINGAKAKLFITSKSSINKRNLLEFITNPVFSKDFQALPANFSDLIKFLSTKKVADINFDSQKDLLGIIAELNFINEKIRKRLRRKRIAQDIKSGAKLKKAFDESRSIQDHASPHDFASLFQGIDSSSNEEIDVKVFREEELQKADVAEIISSLSGLSDDTKISVNDIENLPFDINASGPITVIQFIESLKNYLQHHEVNTLNELVDIFNKANVRVAFGPEDVQVSSIVQVLHEDKKIPTNPEKSNQQINQNPDQSSQSNSSYSSDPSDTSVDGSSPTSSIQEQDNGQNEEDKDGKTNIEEDINQYLINGETPPTEFIKDLIGEELASEIDWSTEDFESDSSKTYVKIFTQRALQHIRNLNNERKLKNFTSTGEGLSQQEIRDEFKNSMPDISYIQKVGKAIDKIHDSKKYSYYFNAHVMDPYKGNESKKWRRVTIPQDDWKTELYSKMADIAPKKLPRTNAEFLSKFTKSTWGDSDVSQLARGTDDRDEFMYLTDKETGQEVRLVDYLQENI